MSDPLQNRVLPDGSIIASPMRGTFFGNRGGKIHDPQTRLLHPTKRWANRQWICCVLDFKNRQRTVMGNSYTELFFLDEVTALSAGHRPCFECRRADANAFARAWQTGEGLGKAPRAPEMDRILHAQRLAKTSRGLEKRTHRMKWRDLPNGAVCLYENGFLAKHGEQALEWTPSGYRAHSCPPDDTPVETFTPPAILTVLHFGYMPHWHPSSEMPDHS